MIITFSHPKGGVGKTSLCFNFAVWLQSKNKQFKVIDLDGQHSISATNAIRGASNLEMLDILTFDKAELLAKYLEENKGLIVIDTGGFDSSFNRVAIAYSDLVITPTSDAPIEQVRLATFNNILKNISNKVSKNIPAKIVLNRIHYNYTSNSIKQIKENLEFSQFSFFDTSIRDRIRIKFSLAQGKNVIEDKQDERAMTEIKSLCKEIKKTVKIK